MTENGRGTFNVNEIFDNNGHVLVQFSSTSFKTKTNEKQLTFTSFTFRWSPLTRRENLKMNARCLGAKHHAQASGTISTFREPDFLLTGPFI